MTCIEWTLVIGIAGFATGYLAGFITICALTRWRD
jgi:hypothetical protein